MPTVEKEVTKQEKKVKKNLNKTYNKLIRYFSIEDSEDRKFSR